MPTLGDVQRRYFEDRRRIYKTIDEEIPINNSPESDIMQSAAAHIDIIMAKIPDLNRNLVQTIVLEKMRDKINNLLR